MRGFVRSLPLVGFVLFCVAIVATLPCCSVGGRLRPGVGISNKIDATGARMGVDIGEYDFGAAAADPRTGQSPEDACPGGVCGIPSVPPFRVEVSPRGLVPTWLYTFAFILGALGCALVGVKIWRGLTTKPAAAPVVSPAKAAGTVA